VKGELLERGIDDGTVDWIVNGFLFISKHEINNQERIRQLKVLFQDNKTALNGISEIEYILDNVNNKQIYLDTTLARGLNYYTGAIFEAKAPPEVKIGSIGGGGRYDDLTGLFGVPNMPGVGISFGVDRIYDVLEELNLFPQAIAQGTQVLVFNAGIEESKAAYEVLKKLREHGIASELYHEPAKADKQFKYAEKKNIPYIIREISGDNCLIKNIQTGVQQTVAVEDLSKERLNF
jgi:histidyl-tRNA synthetase